MNKTKAIVFMLLTLFAFSAIKVNATEWTSLVRLDGLWKFSVGDNPNWSKTTFDDSDWDMIMVPGKWENYIEGYNGFAWYRTAFNVKYIPEEGTISLYLGYVDDVEEVFLNGVKIGQTGSFPPELKSAYSFERRYPVPKGLIKSSNNVLAVRVYDMGLDGGITVGKPGLFVDNDAALMSVDLSGKWKFSVFRQSKMFDKNFDDSKWENINVPATWESQGYPDHDGLAWYRKKFKIPKELNGQNIYLVLGRIDDTDKVYLNGSLIARTENIQEYSRFVKGNENRFYRVYPLPKSAIEDENVLVIEVNDQWGNGGIYDGPIGLTTYENAKILLDRNSESNWENPVRSLLRFLFN